MHDECVRAALGQTHTTPPQPPRPTSRRSVRPLNELSVFRGHCRVLCCFVLVMLRLRARVCVCVCYDVVRVCRQKARRRRCRRRVYFHCSATPESVSRNCARAPQLHAPPRPAVDDSVCVMVVRGERVQLHVMCVAV